MNIKTQLIDKHKLEQALSQFHGSATVYQYNPLFPRFNLSEGALYLAQAGHFWLMDMIASLQRDESIQAEPRLNYLQFWELSVTANQSATLFCEWDKGKTVYTEKINHTDTPLDNEL